MLRDLNKMPILNFKKQFAADVESGKIRLAIITTRKRPIKAGETLHLFCGLRTTNRKRLAVVECLSVSDISIDAYDFPGAGFKIVVDVVDGSYDEQIILAINAGFKNFDEMIRFFWDTHGLPLKGQLIRW
jgi:hypothetical protein